MDIVRVLRIVEYVGRRDLVEEQVRNSIHGTKEWRTGVRITAQTLHEHPIVITSPHLMGLEELTMRAEVAENRDAQIELGTRALKLGMKTYQIKNALNWGEVADYIKNKEKELAATDYKTEPSSEVLNQETSQRS